MVNMKQVLVNKILMAAEDDDICDVIFSTSQDEVQAADTVNYYYHFRMIFCIIFI